MKIEIELTNNDAWDIINDKEKMAKIIRGGNASKFLDDTGLSVIDLHWVYLKLFNKINDETNP